MSTRLATLMVALIGCSILLVAGCHERTYVAASPYDEPYYYGDGYGYYGDYDGPGYYGYGYPGYYGHGYYSSYGHYRGGGGGGHGGSFHSGGGGGGHGGGGHH